MIVLIPAYEPDHRLVGLVDELHDAGQRVVVVDDGSGPAYAAVFEAVRRRGGTVLTHPVNRGKGAALKTGFQYAGGDDVVCADADGQHRVEDILRVAAQVERTGRTTLGVRQFTGPVPLRSSGAYTRAESTRGRKCDDALCSRYTVAIGTCSIGWPWRVASSRARISYSNRSPGTVRSHPSIGAG